MLNNGRIRTIKKIEESYGLCSARSKENVRVVMSNEILVVDIGYR
jgi:hypothetical protein